MTISWRGGHIVEIKTKQSTIVLAGPAGGSTVNEVSLLGPGEYEIADCEVRGLGSNGYIVKADGLRLVYLDGAAQLSQIETDQLANVDVLVAPVGAQALINDIDPKVLIPIGDGVEEFCKSQACAAAQSSFRVNPKDFSDERKIVALKP